MSFFRPPKLGIDLGTANTLVFAPGKGIVINEPTVVAKSISNNKILAVGVEARNMVGKTPDDIIAVQPMRDGVIADARLVEVMLRYFIQKALSRWNIFRPEVMISVPAGITSTQRRAVIEAAQRAGAKGAFVVKEPILAAIGAGIKINEASGYMVVDIGGGTTDVAVISLGGIVCCNSVKHAGNSIDAVIADNVKKKFNLHIGERMAEKIKIAIGSAVFVAPEEEVTALVKGRDFMSGLPRAAEIKTNDVAKFIEKELQEMINAIKKVLQETPPELAADIIDRGIIMTGGTSQLKNLPELVFRRTGVKATVAKDAMYCVTKGLNDALRHLDEYKGSMLTKR